MILAMPTPGENLERLLREQGRSANWLAKRLGTTTRQSVIEWMSGTRPRDESVWLRIAEALKVPLDELLAPSFPNVHVVPSVDRPQMNLVPYWGTVPCGEWERPVSDEELVQISDRIEDTVGVIAVRVSGESLAPRFHDGQIVAIKLSPAMMDGAVTLAKNGDNELALKVLRRTPSGWELQSINPAYGNVSADEVTILGYAISVEEHDSRGLRA